MIKTSGDAVSCDVNWQAGDADMAVTNAGATVCYFRSFCTVAGLLRAILQSHGVS